MLTETFVTELINFTSLINIQFINFARSDSLKLKLTKHNFPFVFQVLLIYAPHVSEHDSRVLYRGDAGTAFRIIQTNFSQRIHQVVGKILYALSIGKLRNKNGAN